MKKLIVIAALLAFCLGAASQEKRYGIKSGIVTMQMDMMGRTVTQKLHFDDYGAKQASLSEMRGRKMRSLEVDGKSLMIDDEEKTAMEMPAMGMGMPANTINFLNLDEKTMKKNKIKVLGEEEVAGKMCTKYSMKEFVMGQLVTIKMWVYEGIVLKSAVQTDFGEMIQQAVSVEENVEIDPAMFTLPEGVEVKKMQMPMGGGMPGGPGGGGF